MLTRSIFFCFLVMFAFSWIANGEDNKPWYRWEVNKGLGGRASVGGYNFDGPAERFAVRQYRKWDSNGQVTDCNSKCVYYHNKNGGSCVVSSGNDCSADCGCGYVCKCH